MPLGEPVVREKSVVDPNLDVDERGWYCLWDAGGQDTITAAQAYAGVTIDLRPARLVQGDPHAGGYVSRENALDHVWGYTIINDVSARDFQFVTSQWGAGKIADTFAPVGPYLADRAEIPDPHVLELRTFVNGKQMQKGNTKTFIFDVRYLVSYLSALMTLSPGDLIATGTPPGVGLGMKPPVFLQPGDVVRMEITGLGSIENPVKEA